LLRALRRVSGDLSGERSAFFFYFVRNYFLLH
jgi:hypothetical protein